MAGKSKKIEKQEIKKEEKVVVESPIQSGMSDMTRGIIIGSVVMALIAALIILLILGGKDLSGDNNKKVSESDYSEAMKEFYEYFESKEKTLIVFASSQCGYCVAQKPIVEAIAEEYGIRYLYIDYLELGSNEEIQQVIEELGIEGSTPSSVVVENGKVVDSWIGYVDGETYVENLVDAGMLKKGTKYTLEKNIKDINYKEFKKLLKGSKVSAVLVDQTACAVCYQEKIELNSLAEKHNFKIYGLSAESFTQEEIDEFIDSLGKWGYADEDYKNEQKVEVPLLLFVKNGKIVSYETGYTEETNLDSLFKKVGLID